MQYISPHTLRLISVRAHVDVRTVKRVLDGLPVRPSGADRIRKVMGKLKIE